MLCYFGKTRLLNSVIILFLLHKIKRTQFLTPLIAKAFQCVLVAVSFAIMMPNDALAQNNTENNSQNCQAPVRYLQISYDFVWPQDSQARMSHLFDAGCVTPSYLAKLTDELALFLAQEDITVRQINVVPGGDDQSLVTLRLVTKASQNKAPSPEMTVWCR